MLLSYTCTCTCMSEPLHACMRGCTTSVHRACFVIAAWQLQAHTVCYIKHEGVYQVTITTLYNSDPCTNSGEDTVASLPLLR